MGEHEENKKALEDFLKDKKMREQYRGKYVVFVGGELVDSDEDEEALNSRVNAEYAGRNRHHFYLPLKGEMIRTIDGESLQRGCPKHVWVRSPYD